MSSSRQHISFLDLAPELRYLIYRILFSGVVELDWQERGIEAVADDFKSKTSILITCRQIRREALPVFRSNLTVVHYGTNISFASPLLMKNVTRFISTTPHWRRPGDDGWVNWCSSLRMLEFWPQKNAWTIVPTLDVNKDTRLVDLLKGGFDKAWLRLMASEKFAGEKVEKAHDRCKFKLHSVLKTKSAVQKLYLKNLYALCLDAVTWQVIERQINMSQPKTQKNWQNTWVSAGDVLLLEEVVSHPVVYAPQIGLRRVLSKEPTVIESVNKELDNKETFQAAMARAQRCI